jgi:hypothetical protein
MQIIHTDGSGRGIVTLRNISEGEAIFTVPIEMVLTSGVARTGLFELVESKITSVELGTLFKKFNVSACETVLLFLLTERFTRSISRNRTMGSWNPYTMLLSLTPHTPIFHEEQVLRVLQGAPTSFAVLKNKIKYVYKRGEELLPMFKQFVDLWPASTPITQGSKEEQESFEARFIGLYKWAHSMISSRGWQGSPDGRSTIGHPDCKLVPLLDLLNHR